MIFFLIKMLKDYMIEIGGEQIFNYQFTNKIKLQFVKMLADYVISKYGLNPSYDQFLTVSKSAILLIPELKSIGGNGCVSIL